MSARFGDLWRTFGLHMRKTDSLSKTLHTRFDWCSSAAVVSIALYGSTVLEDNLGEGKTVNDTACSLG
eukprot:scaffold519_cov331-Pavlova_lutheri.AAC.37